MKLKLVTVPYILENIRFDKDIVEIYQDISYEKLFELYSNASVVVVPLKEGLSYPSGIRAIVECLALNKPVIVSATEYIKANLKPSKVIKFVKPNDVEDLKRLLLEGFNGYQQDDFYKQLPGYEKNISKVLDVIRSCLR